MLPHAPPPPSTTTLCVNEIRPVLNPFDTFEIENTPLGTGGWGHVYRGVRRSDNKCVALKFFGYTNRAPSLIDINNEIVLMFSLVGVEGVVQIESIFFDLPYGLMPNKTKALQVSYPVIVMEDLKGGDLLHRIDQRARMKQPISERYLAATFKSAMLALDSIHKRHYIHRDIKLANLLLVSEAEDSPVKLIDFGSMAQLDRATMLVLSNEAFGTARFMAPETLRPLNKEYSKASDIWQCGCVLYYMLCADAPFKTPAEIKAGTYNTECASVPLSEDAKNLLAGMLALNPADRLPIEAILCHPWLGGTAPDTAFTEDYILRVKTLNIRRKLQVIFEPRCRSGSIASEASRSRNSSTDVSSTGQIKDIGGIPESNLAQQSLPSSSPMVDLPADRGTMATSMGGYFSEARGLFGGLVDNFSRVCGWTGINIDAEARFYFTLFDTDNDGWISRSDLQTGIAQLISESDNNHLKLVPLAATPCTDSGSCTGHAPVRMGPNVVTNIDEMFDVIDVDHTHRIDFDKFRAFYSLVLMPSDTKTPPRWRKRVI